MVINENRRIQVNAVHSHRWNTCAMRLWMKNENEIELRRRHAQEKDEAMIWTMVRWLWMCWMISGTHSQKNAIFYVCFFFIVQRNTFTHVPTGWMSKREGEGEGDRKTTQNDWMEYNPQLTNNIHQRNRIERRPFRFLFGETTHDLMIQNNRETRDEIRE